MAALSYRTRTNRGTETDYCDYCGNPIPPNTPYLEISDPETQDEICVCANQHACTARTAQRQAVLVSKEVQNNITEYMRTLLSENYDPATGMYNAQRIAEQAYFHFNPNWDGKSDIPERYLTAVEEVL